MNNYELDPLTKKYLYWFLAIAIIVGALIYFTAPEGIKHYQQGSAPYSPTYTEVPASGKCVGHMDVVKPLSGGTKIVCMYP